MLLSPDGGETAVGHRPGISRELKGEERPFLPSEDRNCSLQAELRWIRGLARLIWAPPGGGRSNRIIPGMAAASRSAGPSATTHPMAVAEDDPKPRSGQTLRRTGSGGSEPSPFSGSCYPFPASILTIMKPRHGQSSRRCESIRRWRCSLPGRSPTLPNSVS